MGLPEQRIESPSLSLATDGAGPAFELKFLLDETLARLVQAHAKRRLLLDPHGDPALGGAYRTTTLYLDTGALDLFHRMPGFKRRKFRMRRYGPESQVFLERKTRDKDRVRKRRTVIPQEELDLLAHSMSPLAWAGHWFHRRLIVRGLRPTCSIGYERIAYAGLTADGPLRITVDRGLRGSLVSGWEVLPLAGGLSFLPGQVILEFKFRTALPALCKEMLHEYRLNPVAVSKYRRCMEAWGVSAGRREAADA